MDSSQEYWRYPWVVVLMLLLSVLIFFFFLEKHPRFVCNMCRPALVSKIEKASSHHQQLSKQQTESKSPSSVVFQGLVQRILPPKSPSSEGDKEMLRLSKKRQEREQRLREQSRLWKEEIIPQWGKYVGSRKVKELCWSGVPPYMRKTVWPLLIGNKMGISEELFEIHGGRAFEVRRNASGATLDDANSANKEQSVLLIPVDIGRTFPLLGFFQEEGPQHEELRHVLEAYVCLRPDIGYVQGMSFIAAIFLLNMDCYNSFQCLANVLNRKMFLEFFRMNMIQIKKYMLVLEELMAKHIPKVAAHLERIRLTPDMYIMDWFLTLFSKALPLDLAMRIWDCYFFEGTSFMFRAAIGILKHGAHILESADFEDCLTWLTHLGRQQLVEDELFDTIKSVSLSKKACEEVFAKYNLEM